MFILLIFSLVFLWLEITATSFPLFLIGVLMMIILYSAKHDNLVFTLAFFGGLILDTSAVRYLGGTGLFLICWLFLILMYKRKYEIDTISFVLTSSFFGLFSYLLFFGYEDKLIQAIIGSIFSCVLFVIFKRRGIFYEEKIQFN